jgi:pimeloyl-ACP methyl ester carboxylesterase
MSKPSIYYEIRGKGYPLLLISGLNSDSASWAGVCGKLAKHFRVVTFDNRASGRSYMPRKRYSIREMANDAIGLLDRLHIKKCHVIGHSMGGYIAQELAIYHPERVSGLILEATASVSSVRNNMLFKDLVKRFREDRDNEALMRMWSYWLFSPKTFERKNYVGNFIKYAAAYPYFQSAEGFQGQVDAIASFNARARLKNIKSKTLIMIGSDDILIYPAESIALAKGIKGSVSWKIRDTGHCIHVESPDTFISKVVQFLKGI